MRAGFAGLVLWSFLNLDLVWTMAVVATRAFLLVQGVAGVLSGGG